MPIPDSTAAGAVKRKSEVEYTVRTLIRVASFAADDVIYPRPKTSAAGNGGFIACFVGGFLLNGLGEHHKEEPLRGAERTGEMLAR